mmetsp:Transcript_3619/g.11728  ORF Transcript_3619/g.11728 Transcript_3619/m.11728 type:complete len:231 (-) Transcript_3619:222-914(-)
MSEIPFSKVAPNVAFMRGHPMYGRQIPPRKSALGGGPRRLNQSPKSSRSSRSVCWTTPPDGVRSSARCASRSTIRSGPSGRDSSARMRRTLSMSDDGRAGAAAGAAGAAAITGGCACIAGGWACNARGERADSGSGASAASAASAAFAAPAAAASVVVVVPYDGDEAAQKEHTPEVTYNEARRGIKRTVSERRRAVVDRPRTNGAALLQPTPGRMVGSGGDRRARMGKAG